MLQAVEMDQSASPTPGARDPISKNNACHGNVIKSRELAESAVEACTPRGDRMAKRLC
jgi:hypothetical protein